MNCIVNKHKIKRLISESLMGYLLEGDDDTPKTPTVDNFSLVKKLMKFDDDDKVYYLIIVQRKKDNPNSDIKYCKYLAAYWIHSSQELEDLKDEIIQICDAKNARAYIYMNARSAKEIEHYTRRYMRNHSGVSYDTAKKKMSGFSFDMPSRPITFLDVDSDNEKVHKIVRAMLEYYDIEPIGEYKSPNGGLHILLPDKRARDISWKFINGKKDGTLWQTVGLEIDKPSILYTSIKPIGYDKVPGRNN